MEEDDFKNRLNTILSIINEKLLILSSNNNSGRYVKLYPEENIEEDTEENAEELQKELDHSMIQLLNLTDRITIHCSRCLTNKKYVSQFDDLALQCQALLAYAHSWVRLKAAKILNQIFLHVDANELEMLVGGKMESDRGFIFYDTENTFRSLILDLCAQYTPGVTKEMADQVSYFFIPNRCS